MIAVRPGAVPQGRDSERAVLDGLLDGTRARHGGVLVLSGEAGIGKKALLEYLVERAEGCLVPRAVSVQSDMELAFAGLQQLCGPLLDGLDRLPEPQRDAIRVAIGCTTGAAPDRFLVGLGVLGLLTEASQAQPVVCIVDDAPWLDRASAHVLAFVARRLGAESVVLMFAVRDTNEEQDLAGLPELSLSGLDTADARALLASVITGRLDEQVVKVRFRHPLVRSAVYAAATLADRQAAHRALAEATDPRIDPDRRAWHRAQAALAVWSTANGFAVIAGGLKRASSSELPMRCLQVWGPGFCSPRASRIAGHRRAGAPTRGRHGRFAHHPGATGGRPGARRGLQPGNWRATLYQYQDSRVPPAQSVHEARHQVTPPARRCASP